MQTSELAERTARTRARLALGGRAVLPLVGITTAAWLGLAFFYESSVGTTFVDDAYIQLQYARNLIESQTWGFFSDRISNTATSPLNVLVMALAGLSFRSLTVMVAWLTAFELALTSLFLSLIGRKLFESHVFGAVATLGLVANPLLLSTIGLEPTLYILLFVACLYFLISSRWLFLAIALALLTLTRADGFLLFLLALVVAPLGRREKLKLLLVYAVAQAPWYVYSWVHLGSLVPDTLLLKVTQQPWGEATFLGGWRLYLERYPFAALVSLALLPLGLLLATETDRQVRRLALILASYAVLHYVAYAALAVPPYHWYYVHQVAPAVLLGSLGVASLVKRHGLAKPSAKLTLATALLLPLLGLVYLMRDLGVPFREPPIHSNWATTTRYKQVAEWIREETPASALIRLEGEIGTLAFYSRRRLLNEFSDINVVTELINESLHLRSAPAQELLMLNLRYRPVLEPLGRPTHILQHVPYERRPGKKMNTIKTWETSTRWIPYGQIYLRRGRARLQPANR